MPKNTRFLMSPLLEFNAMRARDPHTLRPTPEQEHLALQAITKLQAAGFVFDDYVIESLGDGLSVELEDILQSRVPSTAVRSWHLLVGLFTVMYNTDHED